MAATEMPPMDMTVAVQGLVNLFLNMDGKSREMFIKLLVVKMEEEEVDLILEVVDIRNNSNNDFNVLSVKKDDVKIESDLHDNDSNYAHSFETESETNNYKNTEDKNNDFYNEGSVFSLKTEMSTDNQIPSYKPNHFDYTSEFKCSYCDESFFNKKDLKKHRATHPEYKEEKKPHMCDICPKSFYTNTDLKRHKNMHEGIKPFLCDQCPQASSTQSHLKEHKLACHPKDGPEDTLRMFVCEICSKTFGTNKNLKIHIHRQHTKSTVFSCDQCGYQTTHVNTMKNHKRTHTGERPYVCHICSKTFTQIAHLNRHIKSIHLGEKTKHYNHYKATGEKNYLCDLCSSAYASQQSLSEHKESIHEGIKFHCDQCSHKATNRGNLIKHVAAVHDGITYDCQECEYKASSKQSLKIHEASVHLGIRHECSQCDHKATCKSGLILHVENVHENIQRDCKECNFTTFKKRAFLKHMTAHKNAREMQNQTDFSSSSPFALDVMDVCARTMGGSHESTSPPCGPSLIAPEGQRSDPTQFKGRWEDDERREDKHSN